MVQTDGHLRSNQRAKRIDSLWYSATVLGDLSAFRRKSMEEAFCRSNR